MKRALTPLLAGLMVSGCGYLGLDDVAPLDEAEALAPSDLVAAVHARPADAGAELVMAGQLWVPWGRVMDMADTGIRPVGSTHGTTVYARSWDRAPFDAVFVATDDRWQGYAPVIGRPGAAPADH
ncbi:MAG: hypothetical protein R3314_03315 [Longimicrobiales bacterium]|nr:hypothetical protein [Longimicrobiales bacterium]